MSQPVAGLYRAPDGLVIRVIASNISTVIYWEINEGQLARADDPTGKIRRSMPIDAFQLVGFEPFTESRSHA
jgi:hypothetical protein